MNFGGKAPPLICASIERFIKHACQSTINAPLISCIMHNIIISCNRYAINRISAQNTRVWYLIICYVMYNCNAINRISAQNARVWYLIICYPFSLLPRKTSNKVAILSLRFFFIYFFGLFLLNLKFKQLNNVLFLCFSFFPFCTL